MIGLIQAAMERANRHGNPGGKRGASPAQCLHVHAGRAYLSEHPECEKLWGAPWSAKQARRTGVKRRDGAHTVNAVTTTQCVTENRIALPLARTPETPHYWERRLISCFCFASTLATSSDGPPALVAHSPVGGLLPCFRPGETQSRRGTHSSDSVHSANPEESGAGVTHPRTPPTRCGFR